MVWNYKQLWKCFAGIFGGFRSTGDFFTYMEPLQLQGKGVKSRSVLGSHGHWTVKVFSVYTETREIRLYGHIWISVTSVVERVAKFLLSDLTT